MTRTPIIVFILMVLSLVSLDTLAQNKSKSKSSDKLYERGGKKEITIKNANFINTDRGEFSPVYYQNGIVFVGSRKHGPHDKKTNQPFYELYYSEMDMNGIPMEPEPFSVQLNSEVHEGPVSFSRDMQSIFFTRNTVKKGVTKSNSKGVVSLTIYEATRGYFDWENVQPLPFCNQENRFVHPSLSPDGNMLYFSSDMPGGYGGMDLYVVGRTETGWGVPHNLGPEINSEKNDLFPFFHESGNLFFSSNRSDGKGGLDLYMVNMRKEKTVTSLGEPFNTSYDDLGLILNAAGTQGFFTSSKPGGFGNDDIYAFEAKGGLLDSKISKNLSINIRILDEQTGQEIPKAKVRVLERAEDGFLEGEGFYDVQMVPSEGNPNELVLKLNRRAAESLPAPSYSTNSGGLTQVEMNRLKQYILLASKEGYENAELIYTPATANDNDEIKLLMKEIACVHLKGKLQSADSDQIPQDATITIINTSDQTADIVQPDINGEFISCLKPESDFVINIEKSGYKNGLEEISTIKATPGSEMEFVFSLERYDSQEEVPVKADIEKGNVEAGDIIVVDNIYYDFGKSSIRSGAVRELDALATLMTKYPSMEIELVAHTDCRGSDEFNMDLSLRRAESAKKHLVLKGVHSDKIKAFGMGESELRNGCEDDVPCDESGHAYNRRIEVRIVKISDPVKVHYKIKKP